MGRTIIFFVVVFFVVFSSGFITGYFLERTGIAYTKSELDVLKNEIENMQLQEMFISGEDVDCRLLYSSMGKTSYDLHDLVNRLKSTNPDSQDFYQVKKQADFLSLRAWIIAKNVQRGCTEDIIPVLFFYSTDCDSCDSQDTILQGMKDRYNQTLVYAVDFHVDEPAINMVKAAYEIGSTPSLIIDSQVYGELSEAELESLICGKTMC
jgi:hypothetical protein